MRVLLIGAGVLGSYLAHSLLKVGNDVTILARGERFHQLKDKGLVIKHYFQFKETNEEVNVISELSTDDFYDLIFVVMKYNQFPSIYTTIANNNSEKVVLVGNNANPEKMEAEIQALSKSKKKIGFGFQTSAGMREGSGRVISIHGKGNVMFGDLNGDLSLQEAVKKAFGTQYKVTIEKDIKAWLLTHYVFILPMNSLLYINNFNTKKISKTSEDLLKMIEATDEGFNILKEHNININPTSTGKLVNRYKKIYYLAMKIYFKLPMNKVVSGTFDEMIALYRDFEELKVSTKVNFKNWDELERVSIEEYYADKDK